MFGFFKRNSWARLEGQYQHTKTQELMKIGMPRQTAKQMVDFNIKNAREAGEREGSINLQSNMGDVVLNNAHTESPLAEILSRSLRQSLPDKMSKDGVTEHDFAWWWNLHHFERLYMVEEDNSFRGTMAAIVVEEGLKEGLDYSETERLVWRRFGRHFVFGIYTEILPYWEDEKVRYLPWELKQRVNNYVGTTSRTCFKAELDRAGAMNTLIRRKITQGAL